MSHVAGGSNLVNKREDCCKCMHLRSWHSKGTGRCRAFVGACSCNKFRKVDDRLRRKKYGGWLK